MATPATRTLFQISDDLHALANLLDESEGVIDNDLADAAIDQFLAELGAEIDRKVDNYCALIKELEAKAKARDEESRRLKALADSDANTAGRLKARLLNFFQIQGIQKVDTVRFEVARQNNGGSLPVIIDPKLEEHPEEIPEGYRRVVFSPDHNAIRCALTGGHQFDWASFGERGEHLRIRQPHRSLPARVGQTAGGEGSGATGATDRRFLSQNSHERDSTDKRKSSHY